MLFLHLENASFCFLRGKIFLTIFLTLFSDNFLAFKFPLSLQSKVHCLFIAFFSSILVFITDCNYLGQFFDSAH